MRSKLIKRAFLDSIPVLSGYVVLGMGFGITLEDAGYGVGWALLMSLLIYAGSMQFVGITLMNPQVGIIEVIVTTLMVNARHLFYGVSMIDRYKGAGLKKPYMIFALTDETYSMVCNDKYEDRGKMQTYSFFASLFNQCYWVIGCVAGSLIGSALSFETEGISFSMTALFVTVVVEQWMSEKKHMPAIMGFVSSIVCLLIFGSDNFLIPSMLLITLSLSVMKGRRGKNE